jgi:hypothetical protein
MRTSDRALLLNRGIPRSVRVQIPEGRSSTRHRLSLEASATGYRISDAILGALSQTVPDRIQADTRS